MCWGEGRAAGVSLRVACIDVSTDIEGGKELPRRRTKGPISHPKLEGLEGFQDHCRSPELQLLFGLVLCFILLALISPKWNLAAYKENYFPRFRMC